MFDAITLATLFVSAEDLAAAIPPSTSPLVPEISTGPATWGLPAGSTIDPSMCTVASTVVDQPPVGYDARSWSDPAVSIVQRITLLADAPTAEAAFRVLVTTVDACPVYRQVSPGAVGSTTNASPATEAQGAYPSLVQRTELIAGAASEPQLHGHMLIGNVIVTWTASALASHGSPGDVSVLGSGARIDAMIQAVAARAAASLVPTTPAPR